MSNLDNVEFGSLVRVIRPHRGSYVGRLHGMKFTGDGKATHWEICPLANRNVIRNVPLTWTVYPVAEDRGEMIL
jgi:hypothetical protein